MPEPIYHIEYMVYRLYTVSILILILNTLYNDWKDKAIL